MDLCCLCTYFLFIIQLLTSSATLLQPKISDQINCYPDPYRNFDGQCNNLLNTDWGKSDNIFYRLSSSNYTDCLETSETSLHQILPNSFDLSKKLFENATLYHDYKSMMVNLWGEFLAHDLYRTNQTEDADGFFPRYNCCGEHRSPECYPVKIPIDSHLAKSSGVSCINILRTPEAFSLKTGSREQLNTVTSIIDLSQIYGANEEEALKRRRFRRGQLKTQRLPEAESFFSTDSENACSEGNSPNDCFRKVDGRMNSHPSLTSLYTLWLREHNRVAEHLSVLNPCLTEEEIYQQARAIVIAQYQHITYNEFLPLILGRRVMEENNLLLKDSGHPFNSYNKSIPVNILNEFATAAFRFHRFLVQDAQDLQDPFYNLIEKRNLQLDYFAPFFILVKGMLGSYLRGVISAPMNLPGRKKITETIYAKGDHVPIYDSIAIDIHRGRGHEIAGYNYYRGLCSVGKANSFQDLTEQMDKDLVAKLNTLYRHVNDIDLLVGGTLERPIGHSVFGPTFTCIVAEQFRRLKGGDRFWYETANQPSSFSAAQLKELRKSSLARVICDNIEDMITVQPKVFVQSKQYNERAKCSSLRIPRVRLSHWKAGRPVGPA